jgi:hypothetical protein
MGDNSIFIVFSIIWASVHLKIHPQFQASWQHRLFTLDMGRFNKKMTPFPFNFPSLCSLYFYILLLLMTEYYYHMLVFTKYHWNISFQKEFPVKYVVKNARSVTHFVWQTFLPFNFKCLSNKNFKYINQNLTYYETIVQLLYL